MLDENYKYEYIFTIIINDKTGNENIINNIINQTLNFKDNVQLILIQEKKYDCLNNYENEYPQNIKIITKKCRNNKEVLDCSKSFIKGKYVNLLSDDYYYSGNTLEEVKNITIAYPEINTISLPIVHDNEFKENLLTYDNSYKKLNVYKNPQYPQLNFNSTFIKSKTILEEKFYEDEELVVFLNKILFKYKDYIQFNNLNCYILSKNNSPIIKYIDNKLTFCNELINNFLSRTNRIPLFIQYSITTTLNRLINAIPEENRSEILKEYSGKLSELLQLSSVKTILKNEEISRDNRCSLMSIKNSQNNILNIYDKNDILLTKRKYTFTFIISITENSSNLNNTIKSILNQTFDFNDVQIIIASNNMNPIFDEAIEFQKNYSENIIVIHKPVPNIAALRNLALAYIKSDYVNFIESGDEISETVLEEVNQIFDNVDDSIDICILPRYNFDDSITDDKLDYIFKLDKVINVKKSINTPLIYASSAFIRYDAIKSKEFSTNLLVSEETLLLNKILLDKKRYGIIKNARYYSESIVNASAVRYKNVSRKKHYVNKELSHNPPIESNEKYYIDYINDFYQNIIDYSINKEGRVQPFIQNMILYDMAMLINIPEIEVYDSQQLRIEFLNKLTDILQYINPKFITNNRHLNDDDRKFLMYLRNKYHLKLYTTKDTVLLKSNSYKIDQIDSHKLGIDNIHIKDGNIHMLGNFISYFNEDNIQIKIIKNVSDNIINVYPAKQINYSQDIRKTKKYLSVDWRYNYNFELIVPLCENECEMMFQVTYDNGNVQRSFNPNVTYKKNTGLNYIHNFIQDNKVINLDKSTIKVSDSSKLIFIKNEIDNMRKIFKDKKEGYKDALLVRGIYLLTHPIMKNKKIWLLNDRLDSSDDNAKHLFDYIIKQEDNINKYYVIGKDCDDYKIMKKEYKNIVAYGSLKHKILFLYNQKIISSFLNFTYHNPFFTQEKDYRQLYGNLVNSSIYFLQHGVTARNANHFKRFSNELSLILATSDKEKEFIDDTFNYPKETTQTLGFPRYDNLTDDSKKEIIYMPTWRSYLDKNEEMFKNSNFFKSMNELLNDKKLLGLLDKHGYTLKFKPHPELLKYVELFDLSEDVKISTDEPYQQLFKEGSILISDFSSVLFDFAYLKKPIIYYQPHDDHQYEDSYFSYEDMGFGRVIKDKEKLVDVIAEYIRNDCKMEDVYVERVNSFYKYTDRNNCKRVYEWLKRN